MAVTIPSDLELFSSNALHGAVPANDSDPMHTMLRRCNWLYATHAPPLLSTTFQSTAAASQQFVTSAVPSADGLTYDALLTLYASASSGNVTVDVEESSTSSSAGWSTVTGSPFTHALGGAGDQVVSFSFPIAAASRYFRLTVTAPSGTVQTQHWLVYPQKLSSLAHAVRSSGFIVYDDAYLDGVAGAAIHTEMLNRAWQNAYRVVADRRQRLFDCAELLSSGKSRYPPLANVAQRVAYFGAPMLPEGQDEITVTVRVRAYDSGGTGGLRVGQLDRTSVTLDADDTDQTATLTLYGDTPTVLAVALPITSMQIRYFALDWQRTDIASTANLVAAPAPPARSEYLVVLDDATLRACTEPYAGPVIQAEFENAAGTYHHWHYVISPGTRRMRTAWVRSLDGSTTTPSDTEAYSNTGGLNANDAINVPPQGSGSERFGAMHEQPSVVWGSKNDEDSPSAAQDRMMEVTTDREPATELMLARHAVGFSGRPELVADLSAV